MSASDPKPPQDATIALLADPYQFISEQCQRLGTDGFETHVLFKDTTCLKGPEAAAVFYDPERFKREGAMPSPIRKTLLGDGGVQGLDGDAHRHRKQLFMGLMAPDRIRALGDLIDEEWTRAAACWGSKGGDICLYDELHPMLTRAVCAWAETPLEEADVQRRARQLRALFDAAGARSPRHLWSRYARRKVDRWLKGVIESVREGRHRPAEDTPTFRIAHARDLSGDLLPAEVAAVELANVLRPTVATAVYVVFLAHALHLHPEAALAAGESAAARIAFLQEVRRFYPFFPSLIARTRRPFTWRGLTFQQDRQVILDLYGTNHDRQAWGDPAAFRPDRFEARPPGPFDFVPQGGGDHLAGHRCPGEWIVLEILERSFEVLTRQIRYEVPEQNLSIDVRRLPALPRSGFVVRDVGLT
jgi:fatty-acid peroxygenase